MVSNKAVIDKIENYAFKMRKHILNMSLTAGAYSSHLGGGLSIVDISATLFGAVMNHDMKNPQWPDRDRFILSKGHGCLALYAILADKNFFPSVFR